MADSDPHFLPSPPIFLPNARRPWSLANSQCVKVPGLHILRHENYIEI